MNETKYIKFKCTCDPDDTVLFEKYGPGLSISASDCGAQCSVAISLKDAKRLRDWMNANFRSMT